MKKLTQPRSEPVAEADDPPISRACRTNTRYWSVDWPQYRFVAVLELIHPLVASGLSKAQYHFAWTNTDVLRRARSLCLAEGGGVASIFAWLDHSDRDRKRALDAVDLFREDDTRDELGLGVIRDAFADRLFPGTSTIQTRVRYFLFVPWLFRTLKPAEREAFSQRTRQLQDQLRKSLIKGGESLGVIGYLAGGNVQRLPSSVYWQGLRRLGLLRFNGSETDYAGELRPSNEALLNDDGEPVANASRSLWDPRMPEPPGGWLDATNFAVSREEAEYLTDRFTFEAPESLLAHFLHLAKPPGNADFPWKHVQSTELPTSLGEELNHARRFSEAMHGASLLYNLMLAREKGSDELVETYEESLAEWWEKLKHRTDEFSTWNRSRFWALLAAWRARVSPPAHSFIETWLDAIGQAPRIEVILSDHDLQALIRDRERFLKRSRARVGNPRALDLWNGRSGAKQLDYRWGKPVRQLLVDLIERPARAN